MFKSSTQGGQVAIHGIRMFFQVSSKAFKVAFLLSLVAVCCKFYFFDKFAKAEFQTILEFLRFHISEEFRKLVFDFKNIWKENPEYFSCTSLSFLIKGRFEEIKNICLFNLQIFGSLTLGLYLIIMFLMAKNSSRLNKKTSHLRKLNSDRILSAKKSNKFLKRANQLGPFKLIMEEKNLFGKRKFFYLPKDFEKTHIFISGATGSGKTNLMHNFLPQIRSNGSSAVIVDQTGEMTKRYFDPKIDIIFNPLNSIERFIFEWDFLEEFKDQRTLNFVANSLFTPSGNDFGENLSWFANAKRVFVDIVQFVLEKNSHDVLLLKNLLFKADVLELSSLLKGRVGGALLSEANLKASASILTVMRSQLEWLEVMQNNIPGVTKFTTLGWLENQQKTNQGGFLFLVGSPLTRNELRPLFSVLLELLIVKLMHIGGLGGKQTWFVLDELAGYNKLPILSQALSELRKYGGSILAATQTASQLYKIYGLHDTNTILSQFETKFILRNNDVDMNERISKTLGADELSMTQENISYGAHEMRDGVNLSTMERSVTILPAAEIATLERLECFVLNAAFKKNVAKIKLAFLG